VAQCCEQGGHAYRNLVQREAVLRLHAGEGLQVLRIGPVVLLQAKDAGAPQQVAGEVDGADGLLAEPVQSDVVRQLTISAIRPGEGAGAGPCAGAADGGRLVTSGNISNRNPNSWASR
jgi:hypothetical protein